MENREYFEFEKIVKMSFSYLINKYLFICVESSATYVRYERKDVFISIYHGRQSYEVGLQIGLTEEGKGHGYGIGSFIAVKEGGSNFRLPIARTKEDLKISIERLSTLLLKNASDVLRGDLRVFYGVKSHVEEYWDRIKVDKIRQDANDAFSKGDYFLAKSLYQSIFKFLLISERKKLEIAEKRSGSSRTVDTD
ncbi:hypothetical protein HC024_00470 [Methylococcaceae bacterium WWC4]|nr:hypothetical protein [Methylococcaceae bacterium WWC4]